MEQVFGNYELSRSLFAADGSLLPATYESKLLHILEDLPAPRSSDRTDFTIQQVAEVPSQTLVVDSMFMVQQLVVKQCVIKSCSDLAMEFITVLDSKAQNYDCVQLVFDHYNTDASSLKRITRKQRKGHAQDGKQYVCTYETPIRTTLPVFLKHEKTKASLTEYLAQTVLEHHQHAELPILVSTEGGTFSHHMSVDHLSSSQEEGDTLMMMHANDVHKTGSTVHILSPDTDVFVLALRHFSSIINEA